jgi:membrane protein required for colicin V production
MNYLDIIIVLLLVISAVSGYRKGFIHQLASLVAIILGIFLAVKFGKLLWPFVQTHFISSENISKIVSFISIFIIVLILIYLLGRFLEKIFEEIELALINKLAGSVFSIIKMAFILSVIMVLLNISIIKLNWPKAESIEKSYLYKPIESVAPAIFPYLKFEKNNTDLKK